MKRFKVIATLCLMLLFFVSGEVLSDNNRGDSFEVEDPDGDDHPWGGDQIGGEGVDPTSRLEFDYIGSFSTAYPIFNPAIYFTKIYLKKIQPYFDDRKVSKTKYQSKIERRTSYKKVRYTKFYKQR